MAEQKKVEIVPLNEDAIKGVYCDGFGGNFSESLIALDFILLPPQSEKAYLASRILVRPSVAKGILEQLEGLIKEYEKKYGKLKKPVSTYKAEKIDYKS